MPRFASMFRAFCLLCFGVLAWVGPLQEASAQDCVSLFRASKFAKAGECFEKKAKAMGSNLDGVKKIEKGRLLRNGALALNRAAKSSGGVKAAAHLIKAIGLLQIYLKEKLYENPATRSFAVNQLQKFRKLIGYASLTLVTNHPKAKACLRAPGFTKCKTGAFWTLKLLPKTYQITVDYPLDPPVKKQQVFKAIPRTQKTLVFTPPVKKFALLSIVTSNPKATIIVKGKKLKAPKTHTGALWTLRMDAGSYEIMVVFPGQAPIKRNVTLEAGKPSSQVFSQPGPPVLVINTTPINAQVFINGKYSGNTSIRLKLKPGNTKVEIKRGCFTVVSRTLKLQNNKEYAINVILKRDPAYLKWRSSKKGGGNAAIGWAILGVGVALGGGGAALTGIAAARNSEIMAVRAYDFDRFKQMGEEHNLFMGLGYAGIAAGVVGLGVGIGVLLASRPVTKFDIPCKVRIKDDN